MCSTDVFLGFLAILFPPLPVWVKSGICSADSFINLLLCVLGFLPGLLHAWYIIAKNPTPPFDYDGIADESGYRHGEGGQRIYVFVHDQQPDNNNNNNNNNNNQSRHNYQQQQHAAHKQPQRQGNMNYGTTGHHAPQDSGIAHAGPSTSDNNNAPPPSYAQVVAGDHKIQTQD